MSFRGGQLGQLYIKPETKRLLHVIAKARGLSETADEVGDILLSETIITKYPELSQYLDRIETIEQEMIVAIRK